MAVGGLVSETKFTSSSTDSSGGGMYSHWSAGGQEVLSGGNNSSSANGLPSMTNGPPAAANDLFWSSGWRNQNEQCDFNGSTPFWSTNNNYSNHVVKQQSEWPSSNGVGQPVNGLTNKTNNGVWNNDDGQQNPFRYLNSVVWGPPTSLLEDTVKFPMTNVLSDEEQDPRYRTPSDRPESEPSDSTTDIFSPFHG